MNFTDIIRSANSNLWRSKGRTFLTVLAIFVGSFTIILTTAINTGVNQFIDAQVDSAGGEGYLEMMPSALTDQIAMMGMGSGDPIEYNPEQPPAEAQVITPETLGKVRELDHIIPNSVMPFRRVSVEYVTSDHTDIKFRLNVSQLTSNNINLDILTGRAVEVQSNDHEITLTPSFPAALGFSDEGIIGETITIAVRINATEELAYTTATVVGVQAPGILTGSASWINPALNDAIHNIATEGLPPAIADRFMFAVAEFDPSITNEQLDILREELAELGLSAMTIEDQVGMIQTFFDVILIVFTVFGGIALIAASIGIINTLFMSVQERTKEIGLMKAMGMSNGKVFLSFSIEAVLLGFWGSMLGIALSMIVGSIGQAIATETFLADFPTFQLFVFTPQNLIIITIVIMFIAFLAGTLPARRASRKDPIEALRYE